MRAKIMLLSSSAQDEINAAYAEKILIDLSAAFDHTFSMRQEKIGEKARAADGESLTEKTIRACQDCQAVFVCDAGAEGVQELYDALNLPMLVRSFCVPEVLCGRHEKPVNLYVGSVFSMDEDTLRQAIHSAFSLAQEMDVRLCHAAPTGKSQADWAAAIRVQETMFPQVSADALTAPDAIRGMISSPERMGLLLCPPYAGSIMLSAGTALSTHPGVIHDFAFDETIGVYAPVLPPDQEDVSPFAAALAVGKMLRCSLHLSKEAACLEAALSNVIVGGWETRDDGGALTGMDVVDLIGEQIATAGELMSKSGIE
ncbi:MAG: hypothetical protein IJS41_00815 [Clostridia bacterium]|nr:hypothetical protein [Clostridia bacterium]